MLIYDYRSTFIFLYAVFTVLNPKIISKIIKNFETVVEGSNVKNTAE